MSFLHFLGKTIRALFTVQRHQSAGPNATPLRLIRNALYYYMSLKGKAYFPLSLFFIVNSRCNLRCRFCDVGQQNANSMFFQNLVGAKSGDFPIERFMSLIEEVRFFKPYISITSTEPLLYRPLLKAISHAKKAGLKVNVTTNGFLLEGFSREFVEVGLDSLCVSIDGPPEVHDMVRGIPGTFQRAKQGLMAVHEWKKKLGKATPVLAVNSVVSNFNFQKLVQLMEALPLEILRQVGFMPMVFLPETLAELHNARFGEKYPATSACLSGGANPAAIDPKTLEQQLLEIHGRFPKKAFFHLCPEEQWLKSYFSQPESFMDETKCVFPWFTAQLRTDGTLVGLTRCYPVSLGNIMNSSFLEVWNGEKMREFRLDLRKHGRFPACTRCEGVLYR